MQQRKKSKTYKFVALLGLLVLLTIWGCSPTRRLKENQKLLNKVKIEADAKSVDTGEASDYLQQQPNRKLFGVWRFYLQVYNTVDSTKAARDHDTLVEKRKRRIDRKIARRSYRCNKKFERTGKECKPRAYDDEIQAKPFRQWVQGIGEPPSLYDTTLTKKSIAQLKQYMFNNGYFFASVRDSAVDAGDKMVNVFYKIKAGPQYIIDTVKYVSTDTSLQILLDKDKGDKLVSLNRHFNTDEVSDEQQRISTLIQSKGYFFFSNEFVKVVADTNRVDTNSVKHFATLSFIIKNPMVSNGKSGEDSLAEGRHIQYKFGDMTVNLGYDPTLATATYDTTTYTRSKTKEKVIYFYPPAKKPLFRPKTIDYHIFLHKDSVYSARRLDITLNRLSDLRTFKFINIQFNPRTIVDSTDGKGVLDYDILLTPSMRRGYSIETQGTNTGGNLGIGATLGFINKNLFRGEESLEFRVRGALEFQRIVNEAADDSDQRLFNTQEYGASITLNIPRGVWPINYFFKNKPIKNPRTLITTAFNYQNRPQYLRRSYTLSYGWTWKQNKKTTVTYNPIELTYLNASLTTAYFTLLDTTSQILLRSFDPLFVDAGRVAITWTNQIPDKRKNYVFWRFGAENAGLLANSVDITGIKIGGTESRTAQYFRTDFEIYPNVYLNKRNALAFRAYIGYGTTYGKDVPPSLPFAKAFFSGGSNGMRAWLQRSLGPGALDKSIDAQVDQVGGFKLEFNAEYRLKLLDFLEPALFVDVGNIWLLGKDSGRPGAELTPKFYEQFGVDYGIGIRLDLSFFLLRLDFARRLIDPSGEYEGKHLLNPFNFDRAPDSSTPPKLKLVNPIVFQLGIGYPF